jgi:MSHA biogenesis protein MshQ
VDADNVSSRIAATPGTSIEGGVQVVSGRMKVSNAYGSELLPLPITATVQYYNTAGNWLTSSTDNLTSFNAAANLVPSIVKGPLVIGNIAMPNSTVTVVNGMKTVKISAPGVTGSADIGLGGVGAPSYLLSGSNGAATNPSAAGAGRVTFGIYKGANEFIYMREAY